MYDEQEQIEREKSAQWESRREEQVKREKSIQRLFRFATWFLFLLFISFTVTSIWQARIREKEYELTKRNFDIFTEWEFDEGPMFTISTTTEKDYETASWYDYDLPGHKDYSKFNYTAASRDYPKGTKLIVCAKPISTELKCVQVRVNDYGPDEKIHPERIIDLSSAAFKELAPLSDGLVYVKVYEKLHVATEPLRFIRSENEDEGSKIDESKDKVFINPIHKPVEL